MGNKFEAVLIKAVKNNPYFDNKSVTQLINFANETQKLTGICIERILEIEAKMVILGRSENEIKSFLKVAAGSCGVDFGRGLEKLYRSYFGENE